MKVQVRVNERGALRNGRFAFTNKLTLVSELLQNARRAGATQVTIVHDATARRLTVIDDGCGIEDFQRLLTFNESGWDEDTIRTEHAFGLGFSKCLYAASRVTVTSRGQRLAFQCDDALDQAELDVEPASDADPGLTTVELEGVDLPQLDQLIDRITRGFPLPVVYNGVSQARQHSLAAMAFTATDIGQVHLWGTEGGEPATASALYLQGLLIGSPDRHLHWEHQKVDVIHLDSALFMARMPDRTELIDAEEQGKRIDGAVRQLWRTVLEDMKQKLPPAEFVERYYAVARRQNLLEVFDDVPVVPRQACSVVIDYPTTADEQERYLQSPDSHPTREEVENGTIRLAAFSPYQKDESHATLMYARAAGLTLVHTYLLGFEHWVTRELRDLDVEDIEVVAVEARRRGAFRRHLHLRVGPAVRPHRDPARHRCRDDQRRRAVPRRSDPLPCWLSRRRRGQAGLGLHRRVRPLRRHGLRRGHAPAGSAGAHPALPGSRQHAALPAAGPAAQRLRGPGRTDLPRRTRNVSR